MNKTKKQAKSFIYYSVVAMLILMLLNAFVFPTLLEQQVTQVDYSTFLNQVERGAVIEAEIQDTRIIFTAKDEAEQNSTYSTGTINDPDLVNRLYSAGVKFSQVIP